MNYIKEINAFYNALERKSLTSSAVTLWHALMNINNKAYWPETFTATAVILQYKACLTDSSFKRVRNELVSEDYITYEKGTPNQAPTYGMISLVRGSDDTQQQTFSNDEHPICEPLIDENVHPNADLVTNQQIIAKKHLNTDPSMETISFAHSAVNENPNHNQEMNVTTIPSTNTNQLVDQLSDALPDRAMNQHTNQPANLLPNRQTDQPTNQPANRLSDHHTAPLINNTRLHETTPNQTKRDKSSNNSRSSSAAAFHETSTNPTNQTNPSHHHKHPDAILFYEQNFGIASPFVSESIIQWTHDLPEELIVHAMERALEQGKAYWGYVKGILTAWLQKDIRTLAAAHEDSRQFRSRRQPYGDQPTQDIFEKLRNEHANGEEHESENEDLTADETTSLQETQDLLDTLPF